MRRQHREERFVLIALCMLGLASGCGGARAQNTGTTTPVEVARRTPVPIDYAPAESVFAAQLDLTRLRRSPYISFINGWIEMARTAAQAADGGHDLTPLQTAWAETDGLFVAFGGPPAGGPQSAEPFDDDTSQFVAVMHGNYADGELEQWLRDLVDNDADFQPTMVDGHFVMRGNEENVYLVVTDPHTLVLGVHTDLDATLAIAGGGEPPHGTLDHLRATMNDAGAGQHTLDLAVVATRSVRQLLSQGDHGGSNGAMLAALVETLESLTGHASFDDGIAISLRVDTTNRLSAVAIAQELNNRIDAAASQPGLAMLGLGSAIGNTRAHVDGTACVVELQLDDGATRSLLERLQGLFRLLSSMASQHEDTPEAAPDTDSQQAPLRSGEGDNIPGSSVPGQS